MHERRPDDRFPLEAVNDRAGGAVGIDSSKPGLNSPPCVVNIRVGTRQLSHQPCALVIIALNNGNMVGTVERHPAGDDPLYRIGDHCATLWQFDDLGIRLA